MKNETLKYKALHLLLIKPFILTSETNISEITNIGMIRNLRMGGIVTGTACGHSLRIYQQNRGCT
jgi:hypothetical protein